MSVRLTGLGPGDVAEVIECLLVGAEHCAGYAPELAEHRRTLANQLGDALDALPAPTIREEQR
ncbi:hypothetical protein ABZ890_39575 [Streptomyces sp. NPDC046984]|uniref:hypothetical protein n=1 Tax=Streptomyces sp. NPDC046984 TaxID=3155138 RepID=UPI0033ECCC2E